MYKTFREHSVTSHKIWILNDTAVTASTYTRNRVLFFGNSMPAISETLQCFVVQVVWLLIKQATEARISLTLSKKVSTFHISLIYEDTWHVDGRCGRCQYSSVCHPCNFYDGDNLVCRDRHGKLLGDSQFVPWDSAVFLESVTILLFPYDACVAIPKLCTVTSRMLSPVRYTSSYNSRQTMRTSHCVIVWRT